MSSSYPSASRQPRGRRRTALTFPVWNVGSRSLALIASFVIQTRMR